MENEETNPPSNVQEVTEEKTKKKIGHDCAGFILYEVRLANGDIAYA